MVQAFRRGCQDLGEIWETTLDKRTFAAVRRLGESAGSPGEAFHLDDELWAEVVFDFACAYRKHPIERGVILRSLTPLYLARVASFVRDTENLMAVEVEDKIEQLCLTFESLKPSLVSRWNGDTAQGDASRAPHEADTANLEV